MTEVNMRGTILHNFRWLAGANLAVKPLWFLFLILSVRFLGPEEFGKFMFAVAYVAVISVVFEGGIDTFTLKRLAADQSAFRELFGHTILLKTISATIVGLVSILLVINSDLSPDLRGLILMAILYNAASSLMMHCRFVFRAFEVMQYEARSIIVEKVAIILVCTPVVLLSRTASALMISYVFAYAFSCGMTWVSLSKQVGLPGGKLSVDYLWAEVLRPALPFALMSFFMVVYFRSASLLLKFLLGKEEIVGYYNAGYRIVEAFILIPSIVIGPLYPSFSRDAQDKPLIGNLLYHAGRAILLMSLLFATPIYLFRNEATSLLFGAAYSKAALSIGLLVLAMIPIGMTWVYGSLVAAAGRQSRANPFILLVTLANIGLHFLLIPRWGLIGATVTTVLTEVAIATGNFWIVRDYVLGRKTLMVALKIIGPAVAAFGVKEGGLLGGPLAFQIAVVLSIMLGSYAVLRVVTIRDVRRVLRWG
jgi:O-antigen/teichoic acid export membrane protein